VERSRLVPMLKVVGALSNGSTRALMQGGDDPGMAVRMRFSFMLKVVGPRLLQADIYFLSVNPRSAQLHHGSYVYDARFTIHDVKGFDLVLGKRWMRDINGGYHMVNRLLAKMALVASDATIFDFLIFHTAALRPWHNYRHFHRLPAVAS
jgi:hypothetical protein